MSYREIVRILGLNFLLLSLIIWIPLLIAAYYQFYASPTENPQPHSTLAFFETFVICLALGASCIVLGRKSIEKINRKDILVIIACLWFITPGIAALPFLLSGTLTNPFQAYFEMTSGLTRTGATILEEKHYNADTGEEIAITKVAHNGYDTHYSYYGTVAPVRNPVNYEVKHEGFEAVSKALLLWRSLVQWMGGFGVIVLFVAVLPSTFSGKFFFQPEIVGPPRDSLIPRVARAALQLAIVYLILSSLQIALLKLTNMEMSWLDVFAVTFSTISGGGFCLHKSNIGYYQNVHTEWIVALFMVLGGTNFTIYYYLFRGKFYRIVKTEFFLYLITLFISCCLGVWFLVGAKKVLTQGNGAGEGLFSFAEAVRYGIFQIISSQTTTGFATANYITWPYTFQSLMLILTFVGAMSGSTSGGIKLIKEYIFFSIARLKSESLFLTEPVRQYKIKGQVIDSEVVTSVFCIALMWFLGTTIGTFLFIVDGVDQQTSLGLAACMINNSGITFHLAWPTGNCAFLSNFSLIVSSILMILGRLEFFAILALLVPAFWKD